MVPLTNSVQTAFPATERFLRAALAGASLDAASFQRRLSPCSLARCGGTCCAEGATLNGEEALVLRQITRRHSDFLRSLVPDLPEQAITRADGVDRTALKPRPFRHRVSDYPPHFPETACAFLQEDSRCALQSLADAQGKHPWTYKPLACWLHPISISAEQITLPSTRTDPYPGGFASQTHCGREDLCGQAAHEVLVHELAFLGQMLGRDLLAELRAENRV